MLAWISNDALLVFTCWILHRSGAVVGLLDNGLLLLGLAIATTMEQPQQADEESGENGKATYCTADYGTSVG